MRSTRSITGRQWRYGTAAVAPRADAWRCQRVQQQFIEHPVNDGSSALATASATGSASSSTLSFPRSETVYTSGTAYGPPVNWNPLNTGAFATGTQGLIYEPLYLYDPVKGQYDPWLATGAEASGLAGQHVRHQRVFGVTWSDGQPMHPPPTSLSQSTWPSIHHGRS